jgi:sporulation protein YlmC with PRC-barrel domain
MQPSALEPGEDSSMTQHTELLRKFLGKPVLDIYERNIGTVLALTLNDKDGINVLGVEHNTGNFALYTTNQILLQGDTIILIPPWKVAAETLQKDFLLAQKRFQALQELHRTNKITQHSYETLHKKYEMILTKLEQTSKITIDHLKTYAIQLEDRIHQLEKFLAIIEIQHITGELDEDAYQLAANSLKLNLDRTLKEKIDVEENLKFLTRRETTAALAIETTLNSAK